MPCWSPEKHSFWNYMSDGLIFCILKGLRHNFGLKFNFCIFVLYNKRPIGPNGNQSKQLVEKSHICI